MIQRLRRRHPPSRSHAMTRNARQLLRRIMTRVTKSHSIRRRPIRSANKPPKLMTRTARRYIATIRLCTRRVTTKTRDVRIQPRRDRKTNATAVASMTRRTSRRVMPRVIERDVETPQRRKRFDSPALRVRVTNRANLTALIGKLLRVTTGARRVRIFARQRRLRRIVWPPVTEQARQPRVLAPVMFELRIIRLGQHAVTAHKHTRNDKRDNQPDL